MIFRLDERLLFPDPKLAEEDGLLAVGGDLSTDRLMLAYHNGIFPWYSDDSPIMWYSPHERFVIFPNEMKISKSMRKVLKAGKFSVTINQSFKAVIQACAAMPREGQDGTWITAEMQEAYIGLHRLGYAHSYEVWHNGVLAGGLYGVVAGKVFCGESMFSTVSNASKTAMISLSASGLYDLVDCQFHTPHLESMGARFISPEDYMAVLNSSL